MTTFLFICFYRWLVHRQSWTSNTHGYWYFEEVGGAYIIIVAQILKLSTCIFLSPPSPLLSSIFLHKAKVSNPPILLECRINLTNVLSISVLIFSSACDILNNLKTTALFPWVSSAFHYSFFKIGICREGQVIYNFTVSICL